MKARYIRISTPDQKLERQLANQHQNENLFIDICSGSIPFRERNKAKELISLANLSYVSVSSIDRLGRNLLDILTTLEYFDNNYIILKVDNLGIESLVEDKGELKPSQAFKMIVTVMGQVAQMERETMLERQREGIQIAKAKGKYRGRVRGSKESKVEVLAKYANVVKRLKEGHSLRNTATLCKVSKGTVLKVKGLL